MGVAAWMTFVRERARAGEPIIDYLAERLLDLGRRGDGDARRDVSLFLDFEAVFPARLAADLRLVAALQGAYRRLADSNAQLLSEVGSPPV
jgi:fructuronate reductase